MITKEKLDAEITKLTQKIDYEIYDFKCHNHPNMPYVYFCNKCKQNICPICYNKEHKSHNKIELYEIDFKSVEIYESLEILFS